jgi:hypothetical protein
MPNSGQPKIEVPFANGMYEVLSGNVAYAPIAIGPGDAFEFTVTHVSPTQDHSLRCWLSGVPNGMSLTERLPLNYWHANRTISEKVVIHDLSRSPIAPAPGRLGTIAVPPGPYFLNVLNLVNAANVFALRVASLEP